MCRWADSEVYLPAQKLTEDWMVGWTSVRTKENVAKRFVFSILELHREYSKATLPIVTCCFVTLHDKNTPKAF